MLGYFDSDDFTNVPTGLSPLVRNCAFDGLTSVRTRDGISTTMSGINQSPDFRQQGKEGEGGSHGSCGGSRRASSAGPPIAALR